MTARDGSRVSHFTRPRDERKRMALRLGAAAHIRPRCTAYGTIALRGRTVVRYAMDKKCRACGKGLPEGSTVRKVFCDSECRMNWHAEQRASGTPGKQSGKRSQSAKKVRSTQRSTGAATPTGTRQESPRIATLQPRIPMEQQLLSQAPARAIGYRLVLSPRPHDELPRLSPPIGVDGTLSFWRLRPFHAPNDWRLVDGALYRVLWVGDSGEVVPPGDEGKLPGLLFHLHPCEADRVHSDGVSENEASPPVLAETAPNALIQATPFVEKPTTEVATSEPKGSPVAPEIVENPIEVLRLAADLEGLAEELLAVCLEHRQWQEAERSTDVPRPAMNPQRVERYFALARKLSDEIKPRPIQFLLLSARCSCLLRNWLCDLFRALCDKQRGPEALALYDSFRTTLGDAVAEQISPRLGVLLQSCQLEEATRHAQQCLQNEHADVGTLELCAQILRESGDRVSAERAARRQYHRALLSCDPFDLKFAAGTLHRLLVENGKHEEAERLNEMFGENGTFHPSSARGVRPPAPEPAEPQTSQPPAQRPRNQPYIAPPKIGANADCPCGSKKKYKKCCGKGTQPRAGQQSTSNPAQDEKSLVG